MSTVDTEISNAVTRAGSWGNTASFYGLVASEGGELWNGNYFDGVTTFTGSATPTTPPPTYGAALVAPALPNMADAEAFRLALQNELDAFFANYFSAADAYMAAVAWVLDALTTNDPKLPGVAFNTIWAKARQHVDAQGNDVSDLSLPTLVAHTFAGLGAFDHAEDYVWSKVKAELWTHAASLKIRDTRIEAIVATGEYIKASAKADITVLSGQTALFAAKQNAQLAMAAWYVAMATPQLRDADRERIRKTELRGFDMSDGTHVFTGVNQKVDAYLGAADNMGKVAQAAQASMNSIISSSQVGF